ncbi:MAG: GNAT family N-acetyltransferase [Vicinamibacterales bacterium]
MTMSNDETGRDIDPAQYACTIVLRDGSTLHVRAIRPDDAERLLDLLGRLSPESLRFRFFAVPRPDLGFARRLATVDYDDTFALVGELNDRIYAVARYARDAARPDHAEAAFVTADALQGKGIGTRLLEELARVARDRGIRYFDARVMASNLRMMDVFHDSGFEVHRQLSGGEYDVSIDIQPTPALAARSADRSRAAASASMRLFFEPRTVAVVGANRERGRIGSEILHNLRQAGYTGRLVAVNPRAEAIDGVDTFARMADVPGLVDLAVVCVPAAAVPAVVDDCIAKGVRAIVVISAGFGETGAEGRAKEAALLDAVRQAGVRMIGPNCMGIINTDPAIRLNATFAPSYPPRGSVALLSQSGALGLAILDYAKRLNIGISTFVSVGNKADVSSNDLVQFWADDPRTDVILLYLESFGNPRNFAKLAPLVSERKPIVAVKAGRSRAGARAASSHTGALAASDLVVDAVFRQTGVIRVDTLEELFGVAALLANQPLPKGPRVAILTNAGGPAILAADACEAQGLQLAELGETTVARLRALLPPAAGLGNPIDMLASAPAASYAEAMALLLDDPHVDSVLVIFIPPLVTHATDVARAILSTTATRREKPVLATFLSAEGLGSELGRIPAYMFPEAAATALARVSAYAKWRQRPAGRAADSTRVDRERARAVVDRVLGGGGGWLRAEDAADLLASASLPFVASVTAQSRDEVRRAGERLGYPVVLKVVGPEILHKSDVGGVVLDLHSEAELVEAYDGLTARLGTRMTGALVQPMVADGVELMVGATQDPSFGPVVVCGLGGTLVELLHDVSARVVPLTDVDAREMLDELKGAALLRGYRGAPPSDIDALVRALLDASALLEVCPEIQEMDMNPVKLMPRGLRIVDARVRVDRRPHVSRARRITYA